VGAGVVLEPQVEAALLREIGNVLAQAVEELRGELVGVDEDLVRHGPGSCDLHGEHVPVLASLSHHAPLRQPRACGPGGRSDGLAALGAELGVGGAHRTCLRPVIGN